MNRFVQMSGWTSLFMLGLIGIISGACLGATLNHQFITGEDNKSYHGFDLEYPWETHPGWQWKVSPEFRLYPEYGLGRWRIGGELKVAGIERWEKYKGVYTNYRYPDTFAHLWNLGFEHKNKTPAWWNTGAEGSWRLKVKGEYKDYPGASHRNYLAGEWELYSETADPLSGPAYPGRDFWSQTFFDQAVSRALQQDELFLDAWVLGDLLLPEGEYTPPWAVSADEVSTKLISRISGGWSNHFNNPIYTWQASNYEIQWQQQLSPTSSIKLGLRKLEKTYPESLLKGYSSREHLLRWTKLGNENRWETGGAYEVKIPVAQEVQEELKVWVEQDTRGSLGDTLRLEGQWDITEGDNQLQITCTKNFKTSSEIKGYIRSGWEKTYPDSKSKVRLALKASKEVWDGLETFVQWEVSREWTPEATERDWAGKIGAKLEV